MNSPAVVLLVAKSVDVQWLIAELRKLKKRGIVCWFDKQSYKLAVYGQAEQEVRQVLPAALELEAPSSLPQTERSGSAVVVTQHVKVKHHRERGIDLLAEETEQVLDFLQAELRLHRWGKTVGYLIKRFQEVASMAPLLQKLTKTHESLDRFLKWHTRIFIWTAKAVRLRDHLLPPIEWNKRDKEHAVKVVLKIFESIGARRGGYVLISHAEAELASINKTILESIVALYGALTTFFMAFPVVFECDGLHVREIVPGPLTTEQSHIVREFFVAAMKGKNVLSVRKASKALVKVHPLVVKCVKVEHGSMQKYLVTTFPNEFFSVGDHKIRSSVQVERHEKSVPRPRVETDWTCLCGACGQALAEHSCAIVCLTIMYRNHNDHDVTGLVHPEKYVTAIKLDLLESLCKTVQLCSEKKERSKVHEMLKKMVSKETLSYMDQHKMNLSGVIEFLDIKNKFGGVMDFIFKSFKRSVKVEWRNMVGYPVPYFPGKILVAETEEEGSSCMSLLLSEEGVEFYGVDCEWKPEFGGAPNKLELIQIATEKTCVLLRVGLWKEPCEELLDFFRKPCVKLMKSPDVADFKKLADFGVHETSGVVNLDEHPQLHGSLKRAVIRILQWNLDKSSTLSNWASRSYSPRQIRYAATDAWINVVLWKKVNGDN